jgi:hypothetical protein
LVGFPVRNQTLLFIISQKSKTGVYSKHATVPTYFCTIKQLWQLLWGFATCHIWTTCHSHQLVVTGEHKLLHPRIVMTVLFQQNEYDPKSEQETEGNPTTSLKKKIYE